MSAQCHSRKYCIFFTRSRKSSGWFFCVFSVATDCHVTMEVFEIPLDNLPLFEETFSVDKEKHFVILLTIKTFLQRFEIYPELKNRAKLYALSNEWKNDGIFFMTVSCLLVILRE